MMETMIMMIESEETMIRTVGFGGFLRPKKVSSDQIITGPFVLTERTFAERPKVRFFLPILGLG